MGRMIFRGVAIARGMWRPPKIVIDAPNYTYLHSGVRCLHVLCDRLNAIGISAAVTSRRVDARAATPRINRNALQLAPWRLDQSVVIYPEVTDGNPLGAKHVVRYLLNKPGFFNGRGLESYGENDYFMHFAEEFRPPGLKSWLLRLPLVDTNVFSPPPPGSERHGFLVYSDRYRPDVDGFPGWVDPLTIVSRETPRAPSDLASLYRQSRALIVGERTAAVPEALHCHCPTILVPHSEFTYEPVVSFYGGHGLVLGFDPGGLIRATKTAPFFPSHYAAQFEDIDRRIVECVADIGRYFGLRGLQTGDYSRPEVDTREQLPG
jgi:O-antigen biosynthesis protein